MVILLAAVPAVVAFWKGRGPWMIWALAFGILTIFPASFVAIAVDFGRTGGSSFQALMIPGSVWLMSWFFANLAIRQRMRDEAEESRTDNTGQ